MSTLIHAEAVWNRMFPAYLKMEKPGLATERLTEMIAMRLKFSSGLIASYASRGEYAQVTKELRRIAKQAREQGIQWDFENRFLQGNRHSGDYFSIADDVIEKYLPEKKDRNRNPNNPTP